MGYILHFYLNKSNLEFTITYSKGEVHLLVCSSLIFYRVYEEGMV